jgi:hypothetical protein
VAIIMENFSLFYSNEEDALLSYADIRSENWTYLQRIVCFFQGRSNILWFSFTTKLARDLMSQDILPLRCSVNVVFLQELPDHVEPGGREPARNHSCSSGQVYPQVSMYITLKRISPDCTLS